MKKFLFVCLAAMTTWLACNDQTSNTAESEERRDTTTDRTTENTTATTTPTPDSASVEFLRKAADGGLAEVEAGKMGQDKATNPSVKGFASMMVHDHTGANAEVKSLASGRNVSLPAEPSAEKKQNAGKTGQKTGKAFDEAFMDMMVKDHKETIQLFEKAQTETRDEQVKAFITNTLPKLKMHLDSAQAIQARIK